MPAISHTELSHTACLGDIHAAMAAEMTIPMPAGRQDIKLFSVISSPLHWPWPFASPNEAKYVADSRTEDDTFKFKVPKMCSAQRCKATTTRACGLDAYG